MARSRFCRECKGWHDLNEAWPVECLGHFGIRGDAGPQIITDTIDPIRSMADGKMYDSKSMYRKELRARGCYEVGNDRIERRPTPLPPVRDTLRQVVQQLRG
jgi:hypothetical protein